MAAILWLIHILELVVFCIFMADTLYPYTYVALCTVPLLCKMLLKTLSALARHVPHPPNLVKNYNINAQERMCSLVNRAKLVIFIRGTEAKPECEDSKQLVELLLLHRARFEVVNVLTDYNAEMGIKEYTGDSRIPLAFFRGELVGARWW